MTARLVLALLAASALQTAAEAQPRRPFECKVLHPGDFGGREGVVRSPALVEGEGRPDCGGTCQIRIAFVYGDDVLDGVGTVWIPDPPYVVGEPLKGSLDSLAAVRSHMETWVDDMNQVWRRIGLDVEFRFAGMAHHPKLTGATKNSAFNVNIGRFRERFDAHLVYALLPLGKDAGAAVLGIVAPSGRWRPEDPYTVWDLDTPDGVISLDLPGALTHEIGHNLGLAHDPATRAKRDEGLLWRGGQGFASDGCTNVDDCIGQEALGLLTIMAYPQGENYEIPGFSVERFSTSSAAYVGGTDRPAAYVWEYGGGFTMIQVEPRGVKGKTYPLGEKGVHESLEVLRWNIPRLAMSRELHDPDPEPPPDEPDPETDLILHGGRFTASIEVDPGDSRLRPARPVNVDLPGESSGLFYFFSADNAEVLFKVLNGCGVNEHWWVYTAAATDLYFELTVVDHERSTSKRYVSVGLPPPIADATAFPCSN